MNPVESTFFLNAGGHSLRARTIIPPGKDLRDTPVLVFLHEGLGCIELWRTFPGALSRIVGLPALIYDRYGSGGSEPLQEGYSGNPFCREADVVLPEVLAGCGIDQPLLIGHSDGGSIALQYASNFPDSPVGVIAEAAHVFAEELTLHSIRKAVAVFAEGNLKEKLARYHGERTEAMFHNWADIWLLPENRSWNMEAALPAITCPLQIIQGENDEYGTLAQVEAIAAGASGRAETLILPECAHSPHLQAPEATLAGMAAFIRSLCS